MSHEGYSIAVGITTYNRFDRFKKCFESLLANSRDVDEILVVDDGSSEDVEKYNNYFDKIKFKHIKIKQLPKNKGVGHAKNIVLKYFTEKNYDYIFTIEDDMLLKSPEIFKEYINVSLQSQIHYLNFAEHGMHNKTHKLAKVNGVVIKIYPNIVGAFSMHDRTLIKELGYYDDSFVNAMEHVDYCYQASLKGLTTPFWKFADITNNTDLIEEQVGALQDSSIRKRSDWADNLTKAYAKFKDKHGVELANVPRS